jgi:hypothetical protein
MGLAVLRPVMNFVSDEAMEDARLADTRPAAFSLAEERYMKIAKLLTWRGFAGRP